VKKKNNLNSLSYWEVLQRTLVEKKHNPVYVETSTQKKKKKIG